MLNIVLHDANDSSKELIDTIEWLDGTTPISNADILAEQKITRYRGRKIIWHIGKSISGTFAVLDTSGNTYNGLTQHLV